MTGVGGQLGPPEPTFGNRLYYIAITHGHEALEALVFTGSKVEDPTLPRIIDHDEAGEFSIPQTRDETWRERAERLEEEVGRLRRLAAILGDLDRCEHGRHEGDVCSGASGCDGPSRGNPVMVGEWGEGDWPDGPGSAWWRVAARWPGNTRPPERLIGFTVHARPIVVPEAAQMSDPDAWVQK